MVASHAPRPPTGDLARNPGHVPCLTGNRTGALWFAAHAQSTEPRQSGHIFFFNSILRGTKELHLLLSTPTIFSNTHLAF